MTRSVIDGLLRDWYTPPAVDGFPAGTTLTWHAGDGRLVVHLTTGEFQTSATVDAPVDPEELLSRIDTKLRRLRAHHAMTMAVMGGLAPF